MRSGGKCPSLAGVVLQLFGSPEQRLELARIVGRSMGKVHGVGSAGAGDQWIREATATSVACSRRRSLDAGEHRS
jgi:hypothetical protein